LKCRLLARWLLLCPGGYSLRMARSFRTTRDGFPNTLHGIHIYGYLPEHFSSVIHPVLRNLLPRVRIFAPEDLVFLNFRINSCRTFPNNNPRNRMLTIVTISSTISMLKNKWKEICYDSLVLQKRSYLSDADSNIQRILTPIGTQPSPLGIPILLNSLLYNIHNNLTCHSSVYLSHTNT